MASHRLPVQLACRVLGVAESGYYEWRNRAPSARALRHVWLTDAIRAVHTDSFGTYGARRVHAELTMGLGIAVGHNAVEMLMRRADIRGLPGRKRRKSVHDTPTAVDLVDRNFSRDAPNQLWVTDITEHPTPWIPAVVATVGTTRRPVKHPGALPECPSRGSCGVDR
jgi:putative transposase